MTIQLPVTVVAGSPGADEIQLLDRVRPDLVKPRVTAIVPKRRSRNVRLPVSYTHLTLPTNREV